MRDSETLPSTTLQSRRKETTKQIKTWHMKYKRIDGVTYFEGDWKKDVPGREYRKELAVICLGVVALIIFHLLGII